MKILLTLKKERTSHGEYIHGEHISYENNNKSINRYI